VNPDCSTYAKLSNTLGLAWVVTNWGPNKFPGYTDTTGSGAT
jgi:hypothetical protein